MSQDEKIATLREKLAALAQKERDYGAIAQAAEVLAGIDPAEIAEVSVTIRGRTFKANLVASQLIPALSAQAQTALEDLNGLKAEIAGE